MDKIGRRQLLKGGAGGALALGALGLAAVPALAGIVAEGPAGGQCVPVGSRHA